MLWSGVKACVCSGVGVTGWPRHNTLPHHRFWCRNAVFSRAGQPIAVGNLASPTRAECHVGQHLSRADKLPYARQEPVPAAHPGRAHLISVTPTTHPTHSPHLSLSPGTQDTLTSYLSYTHTSCSHHTCTHPIVTSPSPHSSHPPHTNHALLTPIHLSQLFSTNKPTEIHPQKLT